jgi:hypothetical protein
MEELMQLGLVTIQRNRGPWLVEWVAFHYLMGFRKFYIYAHLCTDNTADILVRLGRKFDITPMAINTAQDRIQLAAYQHACDNFMDDVDWMCFLDGDEFMFPTADKTLQEALAHYQDPAISAVGVYNVNFGSAGHTEEPTGLITENFRMRAHPDFMAQRRVKSFVKGHQKVATTQISNLFATQHGTVDELLRPVTWGYMPDYVPSYTRLRFNHYVCQSYSYYQSFKKHSGHADSSAEAVRTDEWWQNFDTNHERDDSLARFSVDLRNLVEELHSELGLGRLPSPPAISPQ